MNTLLKMLLTLFAAYVQKVLGAQAEFGEIGGEIAGLCLREWGSACAQPHGKQGEVTAVAAEGVTGKPVFKPQAVDEAVEFGACGGGQGRLCSAGSWLHVAPSWRNSQRLTSSSQPPLLWAKPPRP